MSMQAAPETPIAPLRILQERAEARFILYEAGDFDLFDALEPLYAYAEENKINAKVAMQIIRAAFQNMDL